MLSIFKEADKLAKVGPVKARSVKKSKGGIITRRNGLIIKDTVKRKKLSYPKVKSVEKVDRSELDSSSIDSFNDSSVRRLVLGKYVYNEREQLIRVLIQGYHCSISSVENESFNNLLKRFDSCKAEEAKKLESLKKSKKEYSERLGRFYDSFELVSNVVSDTDTEVWNYDHCEKEEEEVKLSGSFQTAEEKKEQADRWLARKAVLKEKSDAARLLELACKDFTGSEIELILSGKVEKAIDPLAVKRKEERERRIANFVSHGVEYMDAVNKVNQWEASL